MIEKFYYPNWICIPRKKSDKLWFEKAFKLMMVVVDYVRTKLGFFKAFKMVLDSL